MPTLRLSLLFVLALGAHASPILYESASMGTPGQSSGVASIFNESFIGARFTLTTTTTVTDIGAHLLGLGSFFGAIVELSGPSALPTGNPFDGTLMGTTTFTLPTVSSSDVIAPLSLTLNPGNYALIIGTGLFGSNGIGQLAGTNTLTPGATFLKWNGTIGAPLWSDTCCGGQAPRLTVYGTSTVPEPASVFLLGIGLLVLCVLQRQRA